jgi:hypothetical protein
VCCYVRVEFGVLVRFRPDVVVVLAWLWHGFDKVLVRFSCDLGEVLIWLLESCWFGFVMGQVGLGVVLV